METYCPDRRGTHFKGGSEMNYQKGDIIKSEKKHELWELYHPAIIWENTDDNQDTFTGIMLTTEPDWKGHKNIELSIETHITFSQNKYRDIWLKGKSYFVTEKLIKKHDWGPFEVIGRLTEDGINYIDGHLSQNRPRTFKEYRQKNK